MERKPNIEVHDNADARRYEAHVEEATAVAMYELKGDTITLTHTIVPAALEGRGVGSVLARAALDDARARHLHVIPQCPFIASYIRRHGEYADLVPAEYHDKIS